MVATYPTPITVNPTGAPILPGQNLDNPTNAQLPTPPPTVSTNYQDAPGFIGPKTTPTAVMSSGLASTDLQNKTDTLSDADIASKNQASINAANAQNAATAAAAKKAADDAAAAKVPPQTAEDKIMSQPDTGMQFMYDVNTGAQTQIANGAPIPQGFTTVDVKNAPAVDSVQNNNGTTIKQFNNPDGTPAYGLYDASGKYVGPETAQDYNNIKGMNDTQTKLDSIVNGTYPLTPEEQGVIDNIKNQYGQLIDAKKTEYANIQGNTAGLSNLFGMGGSSVAVSDINKVIGDMTAAVSDLNDKMNSAIASAKAGMKVNDINAITKAHDNYVNAVDARNTAIKDAQAIIQKQVDKDATDLQNYLYKANLDHPDAGLDGTEKSIAEINAKVLASETFKAKQTVVDTTPVDGNAPDPATADVPSATTGKTLDALWKDSNDYNLTGKTVQSYTGGITSTSAAAAYKVQISNKSAEILKAAGITSSSVLQQEFKANSLALNGLTKYMNNMDLYTSKAEQSATQILSTFSNIGLNTFDSTLANQTLNDASKKLTDSGDIRAYQAGIKELSVDYAQVFSRGGVMTDQQNKEAEDILNGNITLKDLQGVADELSAQAKINVQTSIDQMKKVANGGVDDVVKYLNYMANAPKGSDGTTSTTDTTSPDNGGGGTTATGAAATYAGGGAF
jgi:hypothetical protein